MNGLEARRNGLKTGFRNLDDMIDIGCGIILIRSLDVPFLSRMALNILARNYKPGKKSLYLHWVDYHKRYWTIDHDYLAGLAKQCGVDPDALFESVYFRRTFSRDGNEIGGNWEIEVDADFIILDSLSELYCEGKNSRAMVYSIGKFVQLCIRNECPGIILDYSRISHPYAEQVASIILEIENGAVSALKHPVLGEVRADLNEQQRLWRWVC